MIHVYTDNSSPNGFKVLIALEEAGAEYKVHFVDINKGENRQPEFLKLNPHGRVPVLVDDETGVIVFESGAILLYLADRFPSLLPENIVDHWQGIQWMVYHSASVGPTIGQYFNFSVSDKGENQGATARFDRLMNEAFKVLEQHLQGREFFAGNRISIADIANFGWFYSMKVYNVPIGNYLNIERWYQSIFKRDNVQKALNHPTLAK